MRNILLKIQYDGTDFAGFQRQQEGIRTVQGEVENALTLACQTPVKIEGCSRTDAGVHANALCASMLLPDGGIPTDKIPRAANDILAFDKLEGIGDIKILSATEMPEGFHARHDCKGKRYIYKICNAAEKSPFRRRAFYQIAKPLDVDAMRRAAAHIVGKHDFKCFESSNNQKREDTVRTIFKIDIKQEFMPTASSSATAVESEAFTAINQPDARAVPNNSGQPDAGIQPTGSDKPELGPTAAAANQAPAPRDSFITISVEGDGFLYNMVRIIVGTLVEVGQGRRSADEIPAIIESKDRGNAGHTAPPQGLYLDEVFY